MGNKIVSLAAGGIDSAVMLTQQKSEGYEVNVVTFDFGRRSKKGIDALEKLCRRLSLPLKVYELLLVKDFVVPRPSNIDPDEQQLIIPNKMMILCGIGGGIAIERGAPLSIGVNASDEQNIGDCSLDSVRGIESSLQVQGGELLLPLWELDRREVIKLGKTFEVDFTETWSCESRKTYHCAQCEGCLERILTFQESGISDPTEYQLGTIVGSQDELRRRRLLR